MSNECCAKCRYCHRLKHNFKVGVGFEESHCCDVILHLPDGDTPWVQEVTPQDRCEMYKEKDHIADADKMIEPTTNDCETCIHNKGVLECDMYGCKYESSTKNDIRDNRVKDELNQVKNELEPTTKKNDLPHCQYSDEEIAKSFIEDVEVVKDQLPNKNDLGVDAISRQQAIDAFPDLLPNIGYNKKAITKILQELPSVTPQERKGHWIPVFQGDEIIDYRCSCCEFGNTFGKGTVGMNYCPRCGSRNEVEE